MNEHPNCVWCNSNRTEFNIQLFEPVGPNLYCSYDEYACLACERTFVAGSTRLVNSNNEEVAS